MSLFVSVNRYDQSEKKLICDQEICDLLADVFNACSELLENAEYLEQDGMIDGYKVPSDYIEKLFDLFEKWEKLQPT